MFSLKEIIKNKDKREELIKETRYEIALNEEESKLLYYSYKKIDDIEDFINVIGKKFYMLTEFDILEDRIPSQKELPEMKYLKKLNCSETNVEKISYLKNLKVLYCSNTNVEKIPKLEKLEKLYCWNTKIKEIPYMPNLKRIHPMKYRNKE